jgi:predicted SAM-dependent methyltransferase
MSSKLARTLAKMPTRWCSMIKLHLGCGWRNFGDDWVHIDGGDYEHLQHDDITKLPYEDESVDLIYASHVLEYFDREEVVDILSEWTRVLKKGAVLRIAVPDFESMAIMYVMNKNTIKKVGLSSFLGPLYGKMEMGDQTIYHKTTYDFDELSNILESVGIQNVTRYDWRDTEHSEFDDHSQAYIPHMDKDNGTLISLNVEGIK